MKGKIELGILNNAVNFLTRVARWIALVIIIILMFVTVAVVISKVLGTPIVGDTEIVELGMVALIMMGLAYTEQQDGHISIELISKIVSKKVDKALTIFSSLLMMLSTFLVAYFYVKVAMKHIFDMPMQTTILKVPFYPFDYIIVLGFLLWGLQAFLKIVKTITGDEEKLQA